MGVPAAASPIQPSMSVSQERYSKTPSWAVLRSSVRRNGNMPVGPGALEAAQPIASSSFRTPAAGPR